MILSIGQQNSNITHAEYFYWSIVLDYDLVTVYLSLATLV